MNLIISVLLFKCFLCKIKIKTEFMNRKLIMHKNIVHVHKLYIDRVKNKIYTIMELVKGKEMLDSVCIDGHYSGIKVFELNV